MKKSIKLLMLMALACTGCKPQTEEVGAEKPADSTVVGTNAPIAVKIDGLDLSRKEIVRRGKVMMQLNMNKMRRRKVGKSELKYLEHYCRGAVAREIAQASVRRYVQDHQLKVDTNTVAKVQRDFVRRYGVRSNKLHRWHTVDDLRYMLGKNADRLDEELRNREFYMVATNHILRSAAISVDEAEIAVRRNSLTAYNARSAATNRLVYAHASNVWSRVRGGEIAFEDAARRYSEDKYLKDGIEWGLFTREQLDDEPKVTEILPSLKVGDITPPIESDGGLAILRLDPADSNDQFAFSRIFFRLPAFAEIGSDEELRSELVAQRERDVIEQVLKSVADQLSIEYPDGQSVFDFSNPSNRLTGKEIQDCDL